MEITVTKDNIRSEVIESTVPVLVDFWATWCGPCAMLAPVIEEIANEADGKYKVGKIDVDEEPALAASFGISVIPTLMVFKNGSVVKTSTGVIPKEQILEMLR